MEELDRRPQSGMTPTGVVSDEWEMFGALLAEEDGWKGFADRCAGRPYDYENDTVPYCMGRQVAARLQGALAEKNAGPLRPAVLREQATVCVLVASDIFALLEDGETEAFVCLPEHLRTWINRERAGLTARRLTDGD